MASFKKKCVYCDQEISMSDEIGKKWLPYNNDGSAHDCRTNGKTNGDKQQQAPKKYTLEEVMTKLESLGIIINVERLMKEKS